MSNIKHFFRFFNLFVENLCNRKYNDLFMLVAVIADVINASVTNYAFFAVTITCKKISFYLTSTTIILMVSQNNNTLHAICALYALNPMALYNFANGTQNKEDGIGAQV